MKLLQTKIMMVAYANIYIVFIFGYKANICIVVSNNIISFEVIYIYVKNLVRDGSEALNNGS